MAKSRFDILPSTRGHAPKDPAAKPGPMSTAIRETAQSLDRTEEELKQQRRRNADEARSWRAATEAGLVLLRLPVAEIRADDLARDRADLAAELRAPEMEELKQSIRNLGQKEPVSVVQTAEGYALTSGWRRLNALRLLHEETGDPRFALVTARVEVAAAERLERYVEMVTENVVRKNLSLSEMAGVAMAVARDPETGVGDARAAVARLYQAQSPAQRSYINAFVRLLEALGPALIDPREIGRDLGVQVARALTDDGVRTLVKRLGDCAEMPAQIAVLQAFVADSGRAPDPRGSGRGSAAKTEFKIGASKVTAKKGEVRIKSGIDYSELPRDVLEEACRAFDEALRRAADGS